MRKGNESDILPDAPNWFRDKADRIKEHMGKPRNQLVYEAELDMLERLLDHAHVKCVEMQNCCDFLTDVQLDQQRRVNERLQLASGALTKLRRMVDETA